MQFTAQQIGILLNGSVDGNPDVTVNTLAKIEDAQQGALSFLANPKYEHFLYNTQASVVIVSQSFEPSQAVLPTLVRVQDPYSAFSVLLEQYNTLKLQKKGIEEPSFIHPTAVLAQDVYIGAFSYIGAASSIGNNCKIYPQVFIGDNVHIGDNTTLFPGVKIYYDCTIGSNCIVHSGAVIGSDGFGFAPQADGTYHKVSQIGNVVIGNNVEIGANTAIDRATMGSTTIHDGVKLDNLIQLAHNVEVGKNTVIASQTGVSGSAKIGEHCVIGGQVGIVGHISIANGNQVQAKSGINHSITEEGLKWAGAPVRSYTAQMRTQVIMNRLPELEKRLQQLEKKINDIK